MVAPFKVRYRTAVDCKSVTLSLGHGIDDIFWRIIPSFSTVNFAFPSQLPGDFAVLAALPFALLAGRDLEIDGSVCPVMITNAQRIASYRSLWNADQAKNQVFSATNVAFRGGYDPAKPHLVALSGGVDSSFVLVQNADSTNGPLHRNVTTGLNIRGFDFPVGDSEGFTTLSHKLQRIADPFHLAILTVETNWKSVATRFGLNWSEHFIIGLAATMHLFSEQFTGGFFASDFTHKEEHDFLNRKSHAIPTWMLSSGQFQMEPRGDETTRAAKVLAIHRADLFQHIAVCWKGPRTGENCGKCEKCRRTMLMAFAQNLDTRGAFPSNPGLRDILTVPMGKNSVGVFYRDVMKNWTTQKSPIMKAALRLRCLLLPAEQVVTGWLQTLVRARRNYVKARAGR